MWFGKISINPLCKGVFSITSDFLQFLLQCCGAKRTEIKACREEAFIHIHPSKLHTIDERFRFEV